VGPVRALLFDLGGVVIDVDFGRVLRAWARSADCDPAGLRERFTFDEAYQRHERGELDAAGYFAALRRALGLRLSDEDFTAGWNDLYTGPVPGVPAMLAAAGQHLPLFAFTNSNPTHQREWSTRYAGELSVFRAIFVSSDLGLRKPDHAAFAAVAGRTGFRPAEILFFDDTAENVTGARAAGLQAVLVRSSDDIRSALHSLGIATGCR
jgi:putative hydrolase of the HAD superfamily